MMPKATFLAVTALVLVTGCNRAATKNNSAGNGATTSSAAAAPAAPAPAAPATGGAVDQAFVTGHWGVGGNCSQTINFNADGTATAPGETDPVRWSLEGNTIVTVENNDAPERATVSRSGNDMVVDPEDGDPMTLTRCPAAGTGGAGAAPAGKSG